MTNYSRTTLRELKKRYLNILKKCLLANLLAFSFVLPSMAEPTTETYIGEVTDPNMKMFSAQEVTKQFFSTEKHKTPVWKTNEGASRLGVFGSPDTLIHIGRSSHNILALYDDYNPLIEKDLELQAEFVEMAKVHGIDGDVGNINVNDLYISVANSHIGIENCNSLVGVGNGWAETKQITVNNIYIDVKDTISEKDIIGLKTQKHQQANVNNIDMNLNNVPKTSAILWDAVLSSTSSLVENSLVENNIKNMSLKISNSDLLQGIYGIRQTFYNNNIGSYKISIDNVSLNLSNVKKMESHTDFEYVYNYAEGDESIAAYSVYLGDKNQIKEFIYGGKVDISLSNIGEITSYVSALSLIQRNENSIDFTNKNQETGSYDPIKISLNNVKLYGDLITLRLDGDKINASVGNITVNASGNTTFEKNILAKSGNGNLLHKGVFVLNIDKNSNITSKGIVNGWDNLTIQNNGVFTNTGAVDISSIQIDGGKFINNGMMSKDAVLLIENGGVFENKISGTNIQEGHLSSQGRIKPNNLGMSLNKIISNNGILDLSDTSSESIVKISLLEGTSTTILTDSTEVAQTTIGNNKSKKLTVSATGEFNDQVNDANKLATSLASVLTIQEGEKDLTLTAEEGKIARPMTAEVKDGVVQNVRVSGNGVTESVKDVMGLQVLSFRNQINDVQKRMGDLRLDENTKGTWVRTFGGDVKFGDMGLKNKYNTIQAGADFKKGNAYFGVMASLTEGESDMDRGTGEDKTYGMGVYAGYMTDNGWYVDATAKQMHLQNKFKAKYNTGELSRGSYKTWGTSVSLEAGKRVKLPCGFFVEPQAEIMYGRVQGINYTTSAGVKVEQEAFESLIGRAGLSVGKTFKDKGSVYANVSVLNDFAGKVKTTFSYWNQETKTRDDMGGAWTEFAVGGTYKLNKNTALYGEFATSKGTDLTNPIQWSLGLRFSF